MRHSLLIIMLLAGVAAESRERYFREDHLTGADYLHLAEDGSYKITGREHMGVWVIESGHWEQVGNTITFVPKKPGHPSYAGIEASHKAHTFLTFTAEAAPSIPISEEEVRRRLDSRSGAPPEYVFFEVNKKVYERETKITYPFRARGSHR